MEPASTYARPSRLRFVKLTVTSAFALPGFVVARTPQQRAVGSVEVREVRTARGTSVADMTSLCDEGDGNGWTVTERGDSRRSVKVMDG
jgi:hypothetical protein